MAMSTLEEMETLLQEAKEEAEKLAGGNRAAGTRLRGRMQELKGLAQEVRKQVLELRNEGQKKESPSSTKKKSKKKR